MNGKSNIGKFDSRSDEGIFLGYSERSKAYRVFNRRTLVVEESFHVKFIERQPHCSDHTIITSESMEPPAVQIEPEPEKKESYSLDGEMQNQTEEAT